MIKRISIGIILLAILVNPDTARSNGLGPFLGGALAGVIIRNLYNNCCGYRCDPPAEGCCGPRWGWEDVYNTVEHRSTYETKNTGQEKLSRIGYSN